MKHRVKNIIKDYLTFSAKERNGIIVLVLFGVVAILLSRYYPVKKPVEGKETFQQQLASLKISIDSSGKSRSFPIDDNARDYYLPRHFNNSNNVKGELFSFDPNTLSTDGWRRLGVKDKTIYTIQKFIAKGFKFRKPEDIAKIYGLTSQDAERMIPYVHIAGVQNTTGNSIDFHEMPSSPVTNNFSAVKSTTIDINTADSAAFISLPGIGVKLASRIINFRQKLGGFTTINQIGETYGLADSTFQQVKTRLQCNPSAVKKININTAEVTDLKTHPYIKWNIANAIVNYRMQHGNYKSVEELQKINIITEEMFNKIAPYLII